MESRKIGRKQIQKTGGRSGTYQIGVNNFSYNEERAKSYLYSYPYDKIGYVFITKKGAPEVKTFADAAGKSFEGQSGVSVTTAIESWNEKNPDKKIDITYTDADTAITLQHIEDGTTDLIFLENGKIIEDGPPKEVFNHPKSDRVREFFAKINRMVEPEYSI